MGAGRRVAAVLGRPGDKDVLVMASIKITADLSELKKLIVAHENYGEIKQLLDHARCQLATPANTSDYDKAKLAESIERLLVKFEKAES